MPNTQSDDLPELLYELNRAGLSFGAAVAEAMRLTLSELAALEHVSSAGQLTPGQLARRLHLKSGSVTTLVDRLERRDFLFRTPHPADRRKILLRATAQGMEAVRLRMAAMAGEVQNLSSQLSATDRMSIAAFLRDVSAILDRYGEASR